MAVENLKSEYGTVFIPTVSDVYCKIIITDDNSVDYTLMNTYSQLSADNEMIAPPIIKRSATDALGSFKFTIANDGGRFLRKFNGGELVRVYADATDATTLIYAGRVDNIKYGLNLSLGFFIELTGRDYPELIDKTITGIEGSAKSDISIAGILNEFYNDITLTFWNGNSWSEATYNSSTDKVSWSPSAPTYPTALMNITYQHKKGWKVITEMCKRAGLDSYMEYDNSGSRWLLRTFVRESITNTGSNVAYGVNLISISGFGTNNSDIINRAIVYGKTDSNNVLLLKTENDTNSQSNLWIKDKVFNEGALTTMTDVQDKADHELSEGIKTESRGRVSTLCMPSLRPGDAITVSVPYCNISGQFVVSAFTHTFGNTFKTDIDLTKKSTEIGDLFVEKADPEEFVRSISNPNAMTDSYSIYFDEDPSSMSTLTDAEEYDGKLRISGTKISAIAISYPIITDNAITKCELRRYENFETKDDKYYVSNDGGNTWERYSHPDGEIHTFTTSGNKLTFKILLSRDSGTATSPAYESVSLLYK